jgi:transcriptional regulator with XRE-family HTH domain
LEGVSMSMAKAYTLIGSNLKVLRESLKLSQADLARMMSCSVQTVSNWESERRLPGIRTIDRLAETLGTTVNYLYGVSHVPYEAPAWLAPWWHVIATMDSDEKEAMIALLRVLARRHVAPINPASAEEPEEPQDD